LAFLYLFEGFNALKRKVKLKPKKLYAARRGRKKVESLLSSEINTTTSGDEGDNKEYLFTSSKDF
jgi:hypothetical protein